MDDRTFSLRAVTELTAEQERQWDQLVSLSKVGRLYSSAPWSRMVTRSDRDAPTYFCLYQRERLVAGVTGDLMPSGVPPHYDVEDMLRGGFIKTTLPPWEPAEPMMPCTTVVARAGRAADFRVASAAPRETRVQQLRMLIEKIDRYGRERGARSTALLFTPHALNFAKYGQTDLSDVRRVRDRNQLIVDELGDRARVLEMLIDGDAVASLQFNLHDDIYYARLVGILDTVPKSLAVYFNLAFYSLVELACAEQVKRIVYAQELPGAKTSRGCAAEVQDLWVRSAEPGMPARIKALGEAVDMSQFRGPGSPAPV